MPESSGHDADKRDDPESSASAGEKIATAVEELLGIVVRDSSAPSWSIRSGPSLASDCVSSITRAGFSGERDTRTRCGDGLTSVVVGRGPGLAPRKPSKSHTGVFWNVACCIGCHGHRAAGIVGLRDLDRTTCRGMALWGALTMRYDDYGRFDRRSPRAKRQERVRPQRGKVAMRPVRRGLARVNHASR